MSTQIYIASKTKHAPRWLDLRNRGVCFISTWIYEAGPGDSPNRRDLAMRCIRESCLADRLVLYAEPGEVLKGALMEVGAALAAGVDVYAVGTAQNWPGDSVFGEHPNWHVAATVEEACGLSAPGDIPRPALPAGGPGVSPQKQGGAQ